MSAIQEIPRIKLRRKNPYIMWEVKMRTNGKTHYFTTGLRVPAKYWDQTRQQILPGFPYSYEVNQKLKNKIVDVEKECVRIIFIEEKNISLMAVKHMLRGEIREEKYTFSDFIQSTMMIDEKFTGDKAARSTAAKRRQVIGSILKYQKTIHFSEINTDFTAGYTKYLQRRGLSHNTIARNQRHYMMCVRRAKEEGFIEPDRIVITPRLRVTQKATKHVFLFVKEVQKIADYQPQNLREYVVKNKFLLSCFSGLAHSDLDRLAHLHITSTDSGDYIQIFRQKTKTAANIPLDLFDGTTGFFLRAYLSKQKRKMSNGEENAILKDIVKKVGIDRLKVTFHLGRHTFLTYLAAIKTDPFLILEYAGIKSINTAQIYIHTSTLFFKDFKFDWKEITKNCKPWDKYVK